MKKINNEGASRYLPKAALTAFVLTSFLFCSFSSVAQHPLIGTWEMVSIRGINADGVDFEIDTSTVRETKIITPTHYMLIARDVRGDSLVFNRSYAGAIRLDGNKYIEIPQQASVQIFDNVKTDFTWKVEGDTFTQSGTFTRPDGKKIVLHAMVFKRAKTEHSYPKNPAIGTWSQLSSQYVNFDGSRESHTSETATRLHIITPTHWMRISHRNKKFEHAIGGTYTIRGGKTYPVLLYTSSVSFLGKTEMTERVKNGQLIVQGTMTTPDGKNFTWEDIFNRVNQP